MSCFAGGQARYIADIVRAFNALVGAQVCYDSFDNQLAKSAFPTFVRLMAERLLEELAGKVLRCNEHGPFARFERTLIQDSTSFALKRLLRRIIPVSLPR
jgi:hypothetical protein